MTEREKRIEEMLNELEMWFEHEPSWLSSKAKAHDIVGRLGYRKADEVEKQTIKRVIRELSGHVFKRKTDSGFDIYIVCEEDLKFIESLFGLRR